MHFKIGVVAFLLLSFFAQGQIKEQTDKEYLDSIKATFVDHKAATKLETKWLKEVFTDDLFNEFQQTLADSTVEKIIDYDLPTETLKKRLQKLNAKTPFEVVYNPSLEKVIRYYLKNRKFSYERLIAASKYYFPLFEAKLSQYNLPLEIKYLAIVESALNPKAISRVGASGLWQFMYNTGKEYDLNIDSYKDERYDPVKSTEAMCQYMQNMYHIFGDWNLVLASYNAGPGNVTKAIRRANGEKDYWKIRKHLPEETQGYVPAFLATMYVFEYHEKHGIKPNPTTRSMMKTDTIVVRETVALEHISELLDVAYQELQFLNPAYKLNVVPKVEGQKNILRLPLDKIGVFVSNEDAIYAYCRRKLNKGKSAEKEEKTESKEESVKKPNITHHIVRNRETLYSIARQYGVSVQDIAQWNSINADEIAVNQRLAIYTKDAAPLVQKYHTVKRGETLSVIASKYKGVTVSKLKMWNNLRSNNLQIGQRLKLSR